MDDETNSSELQDDAYLQAALLHMLGLEKPAPVKEAPGRGKSDYERIMRAEYVPNMMKKLEHRYFGDYQHIQPSTSQMQPIEIKVDENSSMDIDEPSTSSSLSNNTPRSAFGESSLEKCARHETAVLARISELRKQGKWSLTRLPMCVDPPRNKTHWDCFLEEVVWMATDFKGERTFKRNSAKRCAFAIAKQFREKENEAEKREQRTIKEAKKSCAAVAKMVRDFWINVDKLVDHRAQEILDAKKKKAMDKHLDFIVGQADMLSSMLQEGLTASVTPSVCSNRTDEEQGKDGEFKLSENEESDDEETIDKEEEHAGQENYEDELKALNQNEDMGFDDLMKSLPPGYLEYLNAQYAGKPPPSPERSQPSADEPASKKRRLRRRSPSPSSSEITQESSVPSTTENTMDATEVETAESSAQSEAEPSTSRIAVDYDKLTSESSEERKQELDNIAEKALKFQPTGNTLDTAEVRTATPSLIRGSLREYQLVGLDWLVTLYDQQLNGILADEMGLGKTIQTISLLAHMACERSVWGPHLIVVPTSVILNWEMELKKWCPAFKVLTYFGTGKERAEKRKGWSKPNAFHVCVTSYKLITQDIRMFKKKAWQYFILDEAQNIKNFKSQRWQMLLNVRAHRRLLLTGTPLQNSLMELWSLMHFLMPAIFASHSDFQDWFSNPLNSMMDGTQDYNQGLVQRLHKVLRPFILRRLKSEVERQLPSKTEHVVKCPLSKRQRFLYDDFMLRRSTREGLKSGSMSSVLNIVMQLRKCCNHPNLFEPRPVVSPLVAPSIQTLVPAPVMDVYEENTAGFLNFSDRLCSRGTGVERRAVVEIRQDGEEMRCAPEPPTVDGFHFVSPFNLPVPNKKPLFGNVKEEPLFDVSADQLQEYGINSNETIYLTTGDKKGSSVPVRLKTERSTSKARQNGFGPSNAKEPKVYKIFADKDGKRKISPLPASASNENGVEEQSASSGNGCKRKLLDDDFALPTLKKTPLRLTEREKHSAEDLALYLPEVLDAVDAENRSIVDTLNIVNKSRQRNPSPFTAEMISALFNELIKEQEREVVDDEDAPWKRFNLLRQLYQENRWRFSQVEEAMRSAVERFTLFVHAAVCDQPSIVSTTNGRPSYRIHEEHAVATSSRSFVRSITDKSVQSVMLAQTIQFPELRLIEYDCGKLQILSDMLRNLYMQKHRVLIFTQMSRMLDVLQAFLSYHGYQYFRLDGSTNIEQRQAMMERFNTDPRIFCFILSTRSGGVGINLTGADTVIFYDSDWNPTMDAQAQDRCHRIGQTRNVHIYRLISERTIEENILKKAMQKRRLGELAIDDAGFTPQFFKQSNNLRDLFENEDVEVAACNENINANDMEKAMAQFEDQQDVVAAQKCKAEAKVELADFEEGKAANDVEEVVDEKLADIMNQLRPIERYAVKFLEEEYKPDFEEEVKEAEALLQAKQDEWAKAHEKAIKEEERAMAMANGTTDESNGSLPGADSPDLYGSFSEMIALDDLSEHMQSWLPLSPPYSEDLNMTGDDWIKANEIGMGWYEETPMTEAQLPAMIHELPHLSNRQPSFSRHSSVNASAMEPTTSRPSVETPTNGPSADDGGVDMIEDDFFADTDSIDAELQNAVENDQDALNSLFGLDGLDGLDFDPNMSFLDGMDEIMKTALSPAPSPEPQPETSTAGLVSPTAEATEDMMRKLNAEIHEARAVKMAQEAAEMGIDYVPPQPPARRPRQKRPSNRSSISSNQFQLPSYSAQLDALAQQPTPPVPKAISPPPAGREPQNFFGKKWTAVEDLCLLRAVQLYSSFETESRNYYDVEWKFVSDRVTFETSHYRSPHQCCVRFQTVIWPKEQGRNCAIDPYTKRQRRLQLSAQDAAHVRMGRTTVKAQAEHEAPAILRAECLEDLNMILNSVDQRRYVRRKRNPNLTYEQRVAEGAQLSNMNRQYFKTINIDIESPVVLTPERPTTVEALIGHKTEALIRYTQEEREKVMANGGVVGTAARMNVDKMEVAREWAASQFAYGKPRNRDVFSNLSKKDHCTRRSKKAKLPPLVIRKKREPIEIPTPVVERPHSTPLSSASSVVSVQPVPPHSQPPMIKQEVQEVQREVHSPAPAVTVLHQQQQQQQQLQMQQQQLQHQQQPPQPRPIQPAPPQVVSPTVASQPTPQKVYHIPAQQQPTHDGQQPAPQPTTRYLTKANITGISVQQAGQGRRISVQPSGQPQHVVIGQSASSGASSSPGQYTVVVSGSDPNGPPSGARIQNYIPAASTSNQSGQQGQSAPHTVYRTIAPGPYVQKRIQPGGDRVGTSGATQIIARNAQGQRQLITTHNFIVPSQSTQGQGSSQQTTYVRNVPSGSQMPRLESEQQGPLVRPPKVMKAPARVRPIYQGQGERIVLANQGGGPIRITAPQGSVQRIQRRPIAGQRAPQVVMVQRPTSSGGTQLSQVRSVQRPGGPVPYSRVIMRDSNRPGGSSGVTRLVPQGQYRGGNHIQHIVTHQQRPPTLTPQQNTEFRQQGGALPPISLPPRRNSPSVNSPQTPSYAQQPPSSSQPPPQ
ncbi:hypothetical protein QR680_013983 [Steinernema hermaphroditum]|uniref:Uncharacterized protein n=1 Tax=Steinernema hermaphroditum TaxID=289476 RepID=A0AA39I8X5_9BILA|nr:hypothetical protein QR680_013983 [Steinernema hermaphroditum]